MSTRSTISVQNNQGQVILIYCHCDGYLEHNGFILKNHYNTLEKALELVALGYLSSLGLEIGEQHKFEDRGLHPTWCTYYNRDRGDTDVYPHGIESVAEYYTMLQNGDINFRQEFNYLFKEGKWFVSLEDSPLEFVLV